jgi:hypothetical protein
MPGVPENLHVRLENQEASLTAIYTAAGGFSRLFLTGLQD